MARQVAALKKVQDESGKPVVVAIRPATTSDSFDQESDFQELCWRAGLSTFGSIARAAKAMSRLLEWQRLRA